MSEIPATSPCRDDWRPRCCRAAVRDRIAAPTFEAPRFKPSACRGDSAAGRDGDASPIRPSTRRV